jgi:hypothetical protein
MRLRSRVRRCCTSHHVIFPSLPCPNHRLRAKGNEEEALNRIKYAFDALYEGTCLNDDQKDFTGQRFIYAADFRLLLTVTGRMLLPWIKCICLKVQHSKEKSHRFKYTLRSTNFCCLSSLNFILKLRPTPPPFRYLRFAAIA